MRLSQVTAIEILDSTGAPTIEVTLASGRHSASFSVPAGKSTGSREAHELRDGATDRYNGQGVTKAVEMVSQLEPDLIARDFADQHIFDHWLVARDETPDKHNLGANTILGLSGAFLRLSSVIADKPLWQFIAGIAETKPAWPRLYANVINGGKHAPGLDVQEFMIIPKATTPSVAISEITTIFGLLGERLVRDYGSAARLVGDEGGYAPAGAHHHAIWEALRELAPLSHFDLACDVAASSFAAGEFYRFEGKSLSREQMVELYDGWARNFTLLSIEDPFAEDDTAGFKLLAEAEIGPLTVGDDLTVTDAKAIIECAKAGLITAVIIKPNQIGTITETLAAIAAAQAHSIKVIISHRSGETLDDFVADLAYGVGAFGLKLGAPCRGERIAKYNRLLAIERSLL